MKTNRKAAVLALGLALLAPLAGAVVVDTEWWKVDFTSPTPEGMNDQGADVGGVELLDGDSVSVLTNTVVSTVSGVTSKPAYASGFWRMTDGDESVITNGVVTNALEGTSGESLHIKLDTQGNDLVWAPSNAVQGVINLVDVDLLLVGSDSAPDHEDFDPTNAPMRVQTAIYLKNEIDEATGETTNSVLCVYAYNTGTLKEEWMELVGATTNVVIKDNTWHHVRVSIDYTAGNPTVLVYVDGQPMTIPSGGTITAANTDKAEQAGKVREVCFRGTGELDNFVGKTRVEDVPNLWFETKVYLDGNEMTEDEIAGYGADWTLFVSAAAGDLDGTATQARFLDLWSCDSDLYNAQLPEWCLEKVVLHRFGTPATTETYGYHWNETLFQIDPDDGIGNPDEINLAIVEGEGVQDGYLNLFPFTNGAADPTNLIAEVYFKTVGAYYANAVTVVGDNAATNGTLLKPVAAGGTYPTNLVWTFDAVQGGNILTNLVVSNGAQYVDYANGKATVKVDLANALAADTDFVTATYVAGSLAEGQDLRPTVNGSTVTFAPYTPPVAIRVSADGTISNECVSLRQAIEDYAQTGDTIYLVADDNVSFSATATEIGIAQAITIDGNGHTLYGLSDYTPPSDGSADHDVYIAGSGNVTITNLVLAGFGDAAYVNQRCYPVWVGRTYAGVLTLDGVTISNFVRTAINVGGGTVNIRNCEFIGDTNRVDGRGHAFQGGVEVNNKFEEEYFATVTIENSTVTGMGSNGYGPDSDSGMAAAIQMTGKGSITIASGSFDGQYSLILDSPTNAAPASGDIVVTGGTFVSADPTDAFVVGERSTGTLTISGGWFDREPEAKFLAAGYGASEAAPGTATPWTVVKPCTIKFFDEDGTTELFRTNVLSGATGYGPTNDPAKAATAQYTYVFTGWTNAVAGGETVSTANLPAVDGDADWKATFSVILNAYDIVFLASDAIGAPVFFETNVFYGATDYGPTNNPAKDSTVSNDFAFAGWTNADTGAFYAKDAALPEATTNATYTALYDETVRKYAITWNMDDGTPIDTTEVEYGTVPTHAAPSKTDTEQFAYAFTGWDPEVVAVEGEATYAATFSVVVRSYDIRFFDGDELDGEDPYAKTNVPYGTPAALYAPADPTKDATSLTNFTFAGWTNEVYGGAALFAADLPTVSNETSWVAVWTETPIWKVDFYAGEDGGTVCYTTNVLHGTMLDQPAYADLDPKPSKAATASHSFTFEGWTDEIGGESTRWVYEIKKDTAFYPVFSSNAVAFAITFWTNGVDVGEAYFETNAPYGETGYGPADPAKDGFAFAGWTNTVDGGATVADAANLPAVDGAAKWLATWTVAALDPVDPGESMTPAEKLVKPPVAVVTDPDSGDVSFTVHFRGEQGVTYQLVASESCDITEEQWKGEATGADASGNAVVVDTATTADADENGILELVAPMSGNNVPAVRFFKIKAVR